MMHRIDPHRLRELAVRAHADPRTVARVLRGERAKASVDARVRAVLAEAGITPLNNPPDGSAPEQAA